MNKKSNLIMYLAVGMVMLTCEANSMRPYHYEDGYEFDYDDDEDEDQELVDVEIVASDELDYDVSFEVDLIYTTTNNVFGTAFYNHNRLFLRRGTAKKLIHAALEFKRYGYTLKITDAYRPLSVQKKMWEMMPDERYVANPAKGGFHTRGAAVDVTLVDAQGHELAMPSKIDEFSECAYRRYENASEAVQRNVLLLESIMQKHGFIPFEYEWWHFNDSDIKKYAPLDISFNAIVERIRIKQKEKQPKTFVDEK